MLKKTLSKITTNLKTLSNESILKDSFISEKLNLSFDSNKFKKINKHNELTKSENNEEHKLDNSLEENEIIAEFNEYSIFNSLEENKLKQNNDDKQIYNYLIKNYKTRKDLDEFINFF